MLRVTIGDFKEYLELDEVNKKYHLKLEASFFEGAYTRHNIKLDKNTYLILEEM